MEWDEVGRDSLRAARLSQVPHARSSVSRAYYAAHSVLARALIGEGYVPGANRQTPPHEAQPNLIGSYFADRGERFVRELRARMRRLHAARRDADYNRRVTIDASVSLQALRDAHAVFLMFEVTP